ncbi:MBL fold metallo-hydrolase [Cellulosimicrobium funkei]|uniref:MBL fold metallo-hydrolase n=1 Tax=Cellulosimicrobium funkei TaxID=264251 RepID=A0A4Y8R5A3_9MICO|nr:MBL fold metallo-hydrolase [Cellulosimicrobium funkei]TFF12781.1 MBL fold metallo-hydrolase [Cellulosimicrobium funkei]TGA77098.1 MBL fold metallo-hydrolase [Cellulosimicrobium terreum]
MSAPTPVTRLAAVLRADNPGPMTLDGTRSYALRAPGSASCVVVDPGPDDATHLDALAAAGPVELVLVTHRHADHTAGSPGLRARTGAPVRAADPDHCHGGAPLRDGEVIEAAGLRVAVLATPGHTADSICLVLPDDGPVASTDDRARRTADPGPAGSGTAGPVAAGSGTAADEGARAPSGTTILTGDTVLGAGTTVIAAPDGSLGAYLASLDAIEAVSGGLGPVAGLPGHGPVVDDLAARVRAYREHRHERLAQVRAALVALGLAPDAPGAVDEVVARVYADVDPAVRGAARQSVAAQLAFLAGPDTDAGTGTSTSTSTRTRTRTIADIGADAADDTPGAPSRDG